MGGEQRVRSGGWRKGDEGELEDERRRVKGGGEKKRRKVRLLEL